MGCKISSVGSKLREPKISAKESLPTAQDKPIQVHHHSSIDPIKPQPSAHTQKAKKTLVRAAKDGDLIEVQALLDEGADINARGMWENTPLIIACQYGHVSVIEFLISHDADPNLLNEKGGSALLYSSVEGLENCVKLLLGKGVDANVSPAIVYNSKTDSNQSLCPLHAACTNGFTNIALMLLEKGANMNFAIQENTLETKDTVNQQVERGITPLACACKYGHLEIVRMLLERGADISTKDLNGNTALHYSVQNNHEQIAAELLKYGASTIDENEDGNSVLHMLSQDSPSLVEMLLQNGANPNLRNKYQQSAVFMACQNGYVKSLKVMVNHGGDLNLLVNEMSALQVAKSLDLEEMNNFLEELGYKSHG